MTETSPIAVKVISGTCVPPNQCSDLSHRFFPIGEEVSESASLHDYCVSGSSRMSPNPIDPSSSPTHSRVSRANSSLSSKLLEMLHVPVAVDGDHVLRKGSLVLLPSSQIGHDRDVDLPSIGIPSGNCKQVDHDSTCCHLAAHPVRSVSAGHLSCILRAALYTPRYADRPRRSHSVGPSPSWSAHMTWDTKPQAIDDSGLDSRKRIQGYSAPSQLETSNYKLFDDEALQIVEHEGEQVEKSDKWVCTSSVWWLDDQVGGDINRKAVFTLGSPVNEGALQSLSFPDPPLTNSVVSGRHLLLPGHSNFEDELTREVAQFELCDFLIGQLECIYATMHMNDVQEDAWQVAPANNAKMACSFSSDDPSEGGNCLRRSQSNFGLLLFDDHKPHCTPFRGDQCERKSNLNRSTTAKPLSVFADLFGVVHQGIFVDPNYPKDAHLIDPSSSVPSSSTEYIKSISTNSACLSEPMGSRATVNLSIQILDSCSMAKQSSRLTCLHRLLTDTCDYDWAHQRSDTVNAYHQLVSNRTTSHREPLAFRCSLGMPGTCSRVIPPSPYGSSSRHPFDRYASEQASVPTRFRSASGPMSCHELCTHSAGNLRFVSQYQADPVASKSSSSASIHFTTSHPRQRYTSRMPAESTSSNQDKVKLYKIGYKVDPDFFAAPVQCTKQDVNTRTINAICTPVPYALLTNPPVEKSKRKAILLEQRNRCAGCATLIESRYLRRMRFCEFFGKYFCSVCHSNTLMVLPGNVLSNWDFRMLPVSNFGRDRLNQLHCQPLLRSSDFNQRVLQNQPAVHACATLRRQGNLILPFVRFCREAHQLLNQVNQLPAHWITSPDLWSLADLCSTRDGLIVKELRAVLQPVVDHLSACVRCQAQGHICEVCHTGRILFPFGQANTTTCPSCMACFHRTCLRSPRPESCPRCVRRTLRRSRLHQRQLHQQKLMQGSLGCNDHSNVDQWDSSYQQNCQPLQPNNAGDNQGYELINSFDSDQPETIPLA